MPNVVGLTKEEAEKRVLEAGRSQRTTSAKANVVEYKTDNRPAGQIIQQLDQFGKAMFPYMDDVGGIYGQVVFRVVVSTGPPAATTFSMPRVIGRTVPDAERMVLTAGRAVRARTAKAGVEYRSDQQRAGLIIDQRPSPGSPIGPSSEDVGGRYGEVVFQVVVSTGPEPAPGFIGEDVRSAQALAKRMNLVLNVAEFRPNPATPRGIIIEQDPQPGQPMSGRRVTVWPSAGYPLPNYVQRPLEEALAESKELGFTLETQSENHLTVASGMIFEQKPVAGTLLPLRGPVTVNVSQGWPVPDFVGSTEPQAGETADTIRVRLSRREQDNFEVPAGIIVSQQPTAGNLLSADRVVRITVSAGYPLPNLVGKPLSEARRIASELKFRLETRRAPMVQRLVNEVNEQRPVAGTRLPINQAVQIVVSDGWPTPDFLSLLEGEANTLAAEKQVSLSIAERRQDRFAPAGVVIGQLPAPGELLPPGQAVSVTVSAGYPTPRFIELPEAQARSLAQGERIILEAEMAASIDHAQGIVVVQRPEPGSPLPADKRVFVTISSGWLTPDFLGQTGQAAEIIADDNQITLVRGEPREDFELSSGLVAEQQPPPGSVIPADRVVKISLSLGWPVAPDAVGKTASTIEQAFLGQYSNAKIERNESFLTFEPIGTVISQAPAALVKLGPRQQLTLVLSAAKPPWTWAVFGLFAVAAGVSAYRWKRADPSRPTGKADTVTGDSDGVRLRVTRDLGVQTTTFTPEDGAEPSRSDDIIRMRVLVDLGEQKVGPVNDKGEFE
ncbi:MAG: PASTA domain-containing protein [Lysobacterales bacterium]